MRSHPLHGGLPQVYKAHVRDLLGCCQWLFHRRPYFWKWFFYRALLSNLLESFQNFRKVLQTCKVFRTSGKFTELMEIIRIPKILQFFLTSVKGIQSTRKFSEFLKTPLSFWQFFFLFWEVYQTYGKSFKLLGSKFWEVYQASRQFFELLGRFQRLIGAFGARVKFSELL